MTATTPDLTQLGAEAQGFAQAYQRISSEVGRVIVGQARVVDAALVALICGGNVLLEGVPGLGKTELVKTLARVLDLDHRRIQFTPDLMPADIVGTNILGSDERGNTSLEFRPGPIFTQLLLADEINRATPKTQSALLETMQEGTVTTGGKTHVLAPPFFVLATQNPIEQEGTYPLPEAQLDRFLFKVVVPYPTRAELGEIATRTILRAPVELEKVLDATRILELRRVLDRVVVADAMRDYAVRIVHATHPTSELAPEQVKAYVRWGASPRAVQGLLRAARVRALAAGRVHVAAADVRHFAHEVLGHRVLLGYEGQAAEVTAAQLVDAILAYVGEA